MRRYADPRLRFSRHLIYNLTRPERSLQLLAPLASSAGGLGLCGNVFADRDDPDFGALLAGIEEAKRHLETITRFDMPNFRPEPEYIREMQRYGILDAGVEPGDLVDVRAADRRYWASFWHDSRPTMEQGALVNDGALEGR